MKLFFLKDDSLYKISKIIEKIPRNKDVEIFIDEDHQFFSELWWGSQVKSWLETRNIHSTFICKSLKTKEFCEKLGFKVHFEHHFRWSEFGHALYTFLFNAKQFHLAIITKKKYGLYVVFAIEALVVLGILYLMYLIVLPGATIVVKPTYKLEDIVYNYRYYPHGESDKQSELHISIPYYTGIISMQYGISLNTQNLQYLQSPAKGTVKFINTQSVPYSLIQDTKVITDNGITFKLQSWVNVPAATSAGFGEATVDVIALETDEKGDIIGARGNIKKGTRLYVRNLKSSFFLKSLYAESISDFQEGNSNTIKPVTQEDLDVLSGKLHQYVEQNKKAIVTNFFTGTDSFMIRFNDLIEVQKSTIQYSHKIGDKTPYIEGKINASIKITIVKRDDFDKAIMKYISQRPTDTIDFLTIDRKSLILYDKQSHDGYFTIPTKISTIRGYNFDRDPAGVKPLIQSKIAGVTIQEALKEIYIYEQIASATIKLSPPRYDKLPILQSRINFSIVKPLGD